MRERIQKIVEEAEHPQTRKELNIFLVVMIMIASLSIVFLIFQEDVKSFERSLALGNLNTIDKLPVLSNVTSKNVLNSTVIKSTSSSNSIHISDDRSIIYGLGYVSSDGENWEEVNLSGDSYEGWIAEDIVFNVSSNESKYFAYYSCKRSLFSWDCKDEWNIIDISHTTIDPLIDYKVEDKKREREEMIKEYEEKTVEKVSSGSSGGGVSSSSSKTDQEDTSDIIENTTDLNETSNDTVVPSYNCSDGILNGDETGIDCGGSCDACTQPEENNTIPQNSSGTLASEFPACGDSLDYQCGQRSFCGTLLNYANCDTGYDCVDNLCIARNDLSCTGVTCGSGEYCSHGVCLETVSGNTYFVATWGDDDNTGTFNDPFYSWQKAVEVSTPGDITYFRGGIWYPTEYPYSGYSTIGMLLKEDSGIGMNGLQNAWISYHNFPGERPILDGSYALPSQYRWMQAVALDNAEYISLKGLTIRHFHQDEPNFSHPKPYSQVSGVSTSGANLYFENIAVHNVDGRGFEHWSSSWGISDAMIAYNVCVANSIYAGGDGSSCSVQSSDFATDNTTWVNCDSYNLFDWSGTEPGNAADGWKIDTYSTGTFLWKGCRAWNYSDDGFDPHGNGVRIFEDNWASSGNEIASIDLGEIDWAVEGNGFKTTGVYDGVYPGYEEGVYPRTVIHKHSIAAGCVGIGYINNLYVNHDDHWPVNGLFYNNFAYGCNTGYVDNNATTYYNNVAYGATSSAFGIPSEVRIPLPNMFYGDHNTWLKAEGSAVHFSYNPNYQVTDGDFVSLDVSQLRLPRKKDGSLPDITFGHLAQGSDLIDSGVVIPGYHCSTAGAHPGEDCVEWYGSAPDLGPFEYIESYVYQPDDVMNIFILGDSTAASYSVNDYPQTGWGMELQQFFDQNHVIVEDKAIVGATARSFYESSTWTNTKNEIETGDYIFIQFGHNDEAFDLIDEYEQYLRLLVDEVQSMGAYPVLLTPVTRNFWDNSDPSVLIDTHGNFPDVMRTIASEESAPLLDMTEETTTFFNSIGESTVTYDYFLNLLPGQYPNFPDGVTDHSHFQVEGAYQIARLVVEDIQTQGSNIYTSPLLSYIQ